MDEIGVKFSFTRERTRQIFKNSWQKIRKQYNAETGNDLFEDDYYRYLYETYDFDAKESSPWLGVSNEVWNYFDMTDSKFYSSLLISDERFSSQKFWGTIIFSKGKRDVFARAFLEDIIRSECRIDLFDLEALLRDDYGCINVSSADIIYKMYGTEVFYDKELQVFYSDQELYYREIDEMYGN